MIPNPSEIPRSSTVVTGSAAIQNCTVADFSSFSPSLSLLCSSREKTSAEKKLKEITVKVKVNYAHLKMPERKNCLCTMDRIGDVMIRDL